MAAINANLTMRQRSRSVAAGLQRTSFSLASTANIDMSNAMDQSGCVLYSNFPPEIRTRIFEFALASAGDPARPYRADRLYYRPGYHYHPKTETSLLQTCKQIFAETRLMPVAEAEHIFWLFGGPYQMMKTKINGMAKFDAWTASLTPDQQLAVNHVHLFAQQYYLENIGRLARMSPLAITTKQLTLTFRHSDWWSWESPAESSDKLGICPWLPSRISHLTMLTQPLQPDIKLIKELMKQGTWGQQICQIKGLQLLRIEFETDELKKAQLSVVLDRAKYWKFPLDETNEVLEHTGYIRESNWEGLMDLKDDSSPMLRAPAHDDPSWNNRPKRRYYVAEMSWKRVTIGT